MDDNFIRKIKKSKFKIFFKFIWKLIFKNYPYMNGNEVKAIKRVLASGNWNMSYSEKGIHAKLEEKFAEYTGSKYAVVVGSGGIAIQMSLRSLGLKHGDQVIHQVDTCVANAFAALNAGVTPIFSDISLETFKLDFETMDSLVTENTKAIMPIHMWGNVENMDLVTEFARKNKLFIIEDSTLAIGAKFEGKSVGSFGDVGIFSFGSTKPLQAGEGGIITTNDESLSKELKTIRNWGDKVHEYGIRGQDTLSWNGRVSEIVAALMLEQLKNYHKLIAKVEDNVNLFKSFLKGYDFIEMADINDYATPIYSQVVLRIHPSINKVDLMSKLQTRGIEVWHANFEPITTLSFFTGPNWKDWVIKGDLEFINANYRQHRFSNSFYVYDSIGIGLMRNNFISRAKTKYLIYTLSNIFKEYQLK